MSENFDEIRRRLDEIEENEKKMSKDRVEMERRLAQEKADAAISISTLLMTICIWVVLCQLWEMLGRPIPKSYMTIGVEVMGFVILIFILIRTSFSLKHVGLNFNNIGKTLKRSILICVIVAAFMFAAKLVIMQVEPGYFGTKPFFRTNFNLPNYILLSVVQEFLARGVTQECLTRIFADREGKVMPIVIASFFFMALHLYFGFYFMVGAGVLSIILGIVYQKDRNIWGVSLIHCILGWLAMALALV